MSSDRRSQRSEQPPLLSRIDRSAELRLPLAQGLNAAFEAQPTRHLPDLGGRLQHQQTDGVVGDEMHQDFLLHHFRRATAQHVHAQGGLDVAKVQFDIPALEVQVRQLRGRVARGIGQGRDEIEGLAAHARYCDRDFDLA